MKRSLTAALAATVLCASLGWVTALYSQEDGKFGGRGFRDRIRGMRDGQPSTGPAEAKPAETKPAEAAKTPDAKPAEPVGPKAVTRPPASDNNNSRMGEQRLTVDDKRMVSFNFHEAPWTFVLEEVARVSGMNLDWQQLPGDTLNLRSSLKYSVGDARDHISQHLLARGYAMLNNEKTQTLTVVNLDSLNPAIVPRVHPDDLEALPPHNLAKVSFSLEWMLAEKAAEEFKSMLSPKAKITPLKTTNRIEVIDVVENLRQLHAVINEEQGIGGKDRTVQEFELRHTRAVEILDQLQVFMGIKKDTSAASPKNMMEAQMQMMAAQQRMQQQQQQPGQQPGGAAAAKPDIKLMANARRNSILVHAPPDQMAVIKSAIWKLDVSSDRPSLSENGDMMKTYRFATLDPEVVVMFLEQVGDLSPQTKLDVDKKNRALIAYADARDQKVIAQLVANLDGTDRQLHVLPLRRLDADLVAGTLRTLMVGEESQQSSRRRRFSYYDPYSSGGNTEETNTSKFRVEADVVANRILVWANEIELQQVEKCLAELGEAPRRKGSQETLRVLDLGGSGAENNDVLRKIQQMWPSMNKNGNKIIIDSPRTTPEPKDQRPDEEKKTRPSIPVDPSKIKSTESKPAADKPSAETLSATTLPGGVFAVDETRGFARETLLAQNDAEPAAPPSNPRKSRETRDESDGGETPRQSSPRSRQTVEGDPIVVTRSPDGRWVATSRDTRALDAFEEMVARLAPPRKDYEIFQLEYATAISVTMNLEEFFGLDKKDSSQDRQDRYFGGWWGDRDDESSSDAPRLARRKPLRFIYDSSTNTILVQGATGEQLRLVKQLIAEYDRPEPQNSKAARMTALFKIRHSKASVIAESIKEVYRDLLSPTDKALQQYNESKNKGKAERAYVYDFGNDEDSDKLNQGRFKSPLSLGVDDSTNTLVVSCPKSLMDNIQRIIEDLDQAALPVAQKFQVLKIDRSVDAGALQKKLADMLKKPVPRDDQRNGQRRNANGNNNENGKNRQRQQQDDGDSNETADN